MKDSDLKEKRANDWQELLSQLSEEKTRLNALQSIPGETSFESLVAQFYNQPLLVSDAWADYLKMLTQQRFHLSDSLKDALNAGGYDVFSGDHKPYDFKDGVATISVRGMLLHRSHAYYSFATGYPAIKMRRDHALQDPDVEGIAWDFSSGGGMVSGLMDFCDEIYESRGQKPEIAIVNEHAYSACYALASSVGNIHVTRTGGVGSIGAVAVLWNFSKALEDFGVKAEVIRSANRKMKPNAIEPLEQEDRDRMQADIDHAANLFIELVHRNTGVAEDVIRGTDAATLRADEAVELGLADKIMSVEQALTAFQSELSGSTTNRGVYMTTPNQPTAGEQQAGTFTQADLDAAKAAGVDEGKKLGAQAENERIFAIMNLDEAKGREASAMVLAKQPGMSADAAKEMLETLPQAKAESGGDSLNSWMQQTGGAPNIPGAESQEQPPAQEAVLDHSKIYSNLNNAHRIN